MHLTLFVPDLLWPDHDNTAAFDFPQQRPLARFLGLATHFREPLAAADSWESVLASTLGDTTPATSLAALRLSGELLDDGTMPDTATRRLLCSDPVNLDFIQQHLVLNDLKHAPPDTHETQAFIARLNEEFAGEGRFFASPDPTADRHWYFEPTDPNGVLPNLAATSRVVGRRIDANESRHVLGSLGLQWINRIQMCLNDHPVNEARQMRGQPSINSVWPWGLSGPTRITMMEQTRFNRVVGQHPLLKGLCLLHRTTYDPTNLIKQSDGSTLVLDTALTTAIAEDNLDGWQSAADALIATWITPALEQLSCGALDSLTLISPNERVTDGWRLDKRHQGLHPALWQRLLGRQTRQPDLATLIQSW